MATMPFFCGTTRWPWIGSGRICPARSRVHGARRADLLAHDGVSEALDAPMREKPPVQRATGPVSTRERREKGVDALYEIGSQGPGGIGIG
jgi:hypothetical protein